VTLSNNTSLHSEPAAKEPQLPRGANRSRRVIYVFAFAFIFPAVLAFIILKAGLYTPGVNNNGTFLKQDIYLEADQYIEDPGNLPISPSPWSIVYPQNSDDCSDFCKETKLAMQQTHIALGKLRSKVALRFVRNDALKPTSLYLSNHEGLVVLEYPLQEHFSDNHLVLKGLIKDVKKLLSYARSEQAYETAEQSAINPPVDSEH
jgi:hypothetical protein